MVWTIRSRLHKYIFLPLLVKDSQDKQSQLIMNELLLSFLWNYYLTIHNSLLIRGFFTNHPDKQIKKWSESKPHECSYEELPHQWSHPSEHPNKSFFPSLRLSLLNLLIFIIWLSYLFRCCFFHLFNSSILIEIIGWY